MVPLTFKKNGYNYELEEYFEGKKFKYAIFRQYSKSGEVICWEVHKLRYNVECVRFGTKFGGGIRLAVNEEFETWGWSCNTLERAKEKIKEVEMGKFAK